MTFKGSYDHLDKDNPVFADDIAGLYVGKSRGSERLVAAIIRGREKRLGENDPLSKALKKALHDAEWGIPDQKDEFLDDLEEDHPEWGYDL